MPEMSDERLAELKSTASWIDDVRELLAEIERLRIRLAAAERVCEAWNTFPFLMPMFVGDEIVSKKMDLTEKRYKEWQSLKDASDV